jgi:hypothetical protein
MVPISYSVAHEQLHHVLAGYKRLSGEIARWLQTGLAAVLWRFLDAHEACVAQHAGVPRFDVVTTVPSAAGAADEPAHPLERIVGEICRPTRDRYEPLLSRPARPGESAHHDFDPGRFVARRSLDGARVLLVDDTWTTGANAQSAAASLKRAGARCVGAVVIGRHLKREWRQNDGRLRSLPRPFDWTSCSVCAAPTLGSARQWRRQ